MTRNRISIVVLFALAGAALSGLLLFDHHGVGSAESTVEQLCGADEASGCDQVSRSRYSTFGGVSVAAIGVFFYGSILFLFALGLVSSEGVRDAVGGAALAAFAVALVLDVALLGLQAFSIGAYCRLCIATYVVNLAALAVLLPARRRLAGALSLGEARHTLSIWAVGSVVILVAVTAVERALASAAVPPAATVLGETAVAPPPTEPPPDPPEPAAAAASEDRAGEPEELPPSAPAAADDGVVARIENQLQMAQARIRELQATLDDPQKYQDYQAEKAAQAFERETPQNLALEGIPFKGPAGAPIQVVEFSDFLCPFCRNLAGAFANFMAQSQGRVAIYFKNYPLDQACNPGLSRTVHDGACEVALGAICANEQGKFWPYHDSIFSQELHNPTNEDVVRIASSAGLDGNAMRQCLSSSAAKSKLDRDVEEGRRVEVSATPTVFVNGKKLEQIGGFLKAIESEAKRLGLPASQ